MMRPGTALRKATAAAALLLSAIPSAGGAATAGPVIHHTPVPYATIGSRISLTAFAACEARLPDQACTAKVFYRTTIPGVPAELLGTADPAWASLQMGRDAGINVSGQTVYSFFVDLPSTVADPRGVDYIIKVTDGTASSWSPGTPALQGIGMSTGFRTGAHHVFVTTPANVVHAPVWQSPYRTAIPIRADVTCSSTCSATLVFRRTGLLQPSGLDLDDPPYNPAEGADVQWASIGMSKTGSIQTGATDQYGLTPSTFSASIPAAYVDTRGVDYFIRVSDGKTRAYWPGTSYNGHVAPVDGARLTWQHVHVLSQIVAAHRQTQYSAPRNTPVSVTADAVCWTELCGATVQYHTYGGPVRTLMMSQLEVRFVGGAKVITYVATIPASSVVSPTLSYRFRITDGYTTAYSPGTFYLGHYIKTDGVGAGEYTVVVF